LAELAPPLVVGLAQVQVGTATTTQQLERAAVGDQVGAVADQHRPFVAITIERDAATHAAGDEFLVAGPVATFGGAPQVHTVVPTPTDARVAALDGDSVCAGIGRANVDAAVGDKAGLIEGPALSLFQDREMPSM